MALNRWSGAIIGGLVLLGGYAEAANSSAELLSQISKALLADDTERANRLVANALAQPDLSNSQKGLLLMDRAKIRESEGQLDDALGDLSSVIQIQSLPKQDQAQAHLERGSLLNALNRTDDAVEDFNAALEIDPHSGSALNYRASAYQRQGRLTDARRDYRAAIAADRSTAQYSNFGLGQIAEAEGDIASARQFYASALSLDPGYRLASEKLKTLGAAAKSTAPTQVGPAVASIGGVASTPSPPPISYSSGPPAQTPSPAVHNQDKELRPSFAGEAGSHDAGSQFQLGVWRTKEKANEIWKQMLQLAGEPLANLSPSIVPVDVPGKGELFRLRVTLFKNAVQFCPSMRAAGFACIAVKP